MTDKSTAKRLEEFGLSKNQADVYLLLVGQPDLRIQEIAELTHIPRSSVYESLKGLYALGLAEEVIEDNFKRVRPCPLTAMRHDIDDKILSLQQQSADLSRLEDLVVMSVPAGAKQSTVLRYYKGRSGARQLYWNSLKAKSTVYAYSDWSRRGYVGMKFYERFVAESHARNIQEQVLTNPTDQAMDSIRSYNLSDSPYARTPVGRIRFLDKATVLVAGDTLMYDDIYAQAYLNNNEINGFEIQSANFSQTQRSIFETFWRTADSVSGLL